MHEDLTRDGDVVGASDRAFGLTLAVIASIIGTVRLVFGHDYALWWLGGGIVLAGIALAAPGVLAPLNRLWLRLGLVLYKVMNPLVMGLIFISAVVPTGLALRAFGKDPLRLRRDPTAASYWIVRDSPGPDAATMHNQF